MYLDTAKLPTYIDESNIKMPIDSNDWWQSAMIRKFGNVMSTLPLKAGYSTRGMSLLTTTAGWLPTPGANDVNISVITETNLICLLCRKISIQLQLMTEYMTIVITQ